MKYRLILSSMIVAAAVLVLATSAGAAPLNASFGNSARFPSRTLVVSVAGNRSLTTGTVHVQENGKEARSISATPISSANRGESGAILVIDTSQSMRGAPLRQAMIAARTLAAERSRNQELGAIEFNHSSAVVLPLTSDSNKIATALAQSPSLGSGTHIYDATLQAIQQLHDAGVSAGTVVVLSDGQDFGSSVAEQTVAAAATADHVRVYTVGVSDRSFTPRTLTALARATGGSYTESSAAGLRDVFTRIESQLMSRYLVKYRSRQAYGSRVHARLWIDGLPGTWTGSYWAPPAPHRAVVTPSRHHSAGSFWLSTLALVSVTLVCAVLLVAGLLAHLVPQMRRHALRGRIGEFTTTTTEDEEPRSQPRGADLSGRTDSWLSRYAWWTRFKEDVDIAAIQRSAADVALLTAFVTLISAVLPSLVIGSPLVALPVLLIGPAVMVGVVRHKVSRQRRLFTDQLPGHLEAIGSAMRAGHSVFGSIAAMVEDAIDPTRREFERAVADERLGVPVDAALQPIARRMCSSDIEQLALVATLNQRTGGNMAEVLDVIAEGARERAELRRELRALTAQARLSKVVVTALPVGLLAVLTAINPTYERPLFTTTGGVIVLSFAAALVCAGWFVMGLLVPAEE